MRGAVGREEHYSQARVPSKYLQKQPRRGESVKAQIVKEIQDLANLL